MNGQAQDGSAFIFAQTERLVFSEAGFDISFGKTDRVVLAKDNQRVDNQ